MRQKMTKKWRRRVYLLPNTTYDDHAMLLPCPASGGILFSRAKKVCKNARGNQWFPPFLTRLYLSNVGSAYIANWKAVTSGQRQELTQRLTTSVAPADSRALTRPPIGALPRKRLALSATGSASALSTQPLTWYDGRTACFYISERCGSEKRSLRQCNI